MPKDAKTVFVVHGRNEALRKSTFDFLRAVGLHPLEWSEAVNLTGEGSPYVGQVLDAAFDHAQAVVVLLTPDEVTYLRPDIVGQDDPETQPATQARPNVLFEAGMAFGHNAKHTVIVEVGSMRPFSDIGGRHTVHLTNDAKQRQAFVERLRTAECDVTTTGTDWLEAGDFTPPAEPGGGLPLGRRVPSAPSSRAEVYFDLKYLDRGRSRIGKLQVINRGTGVAFEVNLALPDNAGIQFTDRDSFPIAKIPGGGKSVTIDVLNYAGMLGGSRDRAMAFDINVSGRTESGQDVSQDVFIDLNG